MSKIESINKSSSRGANYKTEPYPLEFRESAVKLALDSNGPVSHIANNLGISKGTLYNWVSKATSKGSANANNSNIRIQSKNNSHMEEIKNLKTKLDKVTQERDLLKKAAAYFARESQQ